MISKCLIEPEVWVEYHRQRSWSMEDGRRCYKTAEMPRIPALPSIRTRLDEKTKEIIWEYLM